VKNVNFDQVKFDQVIVCHYSIYISNSLIKNFSEEEAVKETSLDSETKKEPKKSEEKTKTSRADKKSKKETSNAEKVQVKLFLSVA
jgi:hypothetical protein